MAHLILVRHGISEWNKLDKWTGLSDIDLAPEGVEDARRMAEIIRGIEIHTAHTSMLKRSHQTFDEIKKALGRHDLKAKKHAALNERDYGVHTGKNKWQVQEAVGEKEFHNIRRGWDAVVVGGENLRDVYGRVVPYFKEKILPQLLSGQNVLVVAHGNSLRALVKYLDNISDEKISELEIGFGEVYRYTFTTDGKVREKLIQSANQELVG
jgi:2,3-bisphosphoglycerate-dependent phosphoglycerate mutase